MLILVFKGIIKSGQHPPVRSPIGTHSENSPKHTNENKEKS